MKNTTSTPKNGGELAWDAFGPLGTGLVLTAPEHDKRAKASYDLPSSQETSSQLTISST
jgi:hypothetical protein